MARCPAGWFPRRLIFMRAARGLNALVQVSPQRPGQDGKADKGHQRVDYPVLAGLYFVLFHGESQ